MSRQKLLRWGFALIAIVAIVFVFSQLILGTGSGPSPSPDPSASPSPTPCVGRACPPVKNDTWVGFDVLAAQIRAGQIEKIVQNQGQLTVTLIEEKKTEKVRFVPFQDDPLKILKSYGVTAADIENVGYEVAEAPMEIPWMLIIFIIFIGIFIWWIRRAQRAASGTDTSKKYDDKSKNGQSPGTSGEKDGEFVRDRERITFADVAGVDEAKKELQEVVEFLKNPERFAKAGARMPRGALLVGPPGTGKTLLARAVAGEAGVPFFFANGSDFVELYVGVGAQRVRKLFEHARKAKQCVIFIDEIDAIGQKRGAAEAGGDREYQQTLNAILNEMDGFDKTSGTVVLAATNRIDVLDEALLRPGRFTRHVIVDRPDRKGREAILRVHLRGKALEKGVSIANIAKRTPGFTGADLENLLNEAAILAARRDSELISKQDIDNAMDRIIAGPEKKTLLLTEEEKNIIAHHECGHAVVRYLASLGNMIPNKISIISRGMALGLTWYIPDKDIVLQKRSELEIELAGTIGGYVAEDILLAGDITTGPSNDLEKLTDLARRMVTRFGMSANLPTRIFAQDTRSLVSTDSQETKARVDAEIEALIDNAKKQAYEIITQNREGFLGLVKELKEKEIMADEELLEAFIRNFPDHEASRRAQEKLDSMLAAQSDQYESS